MPTVRSRYLPTYLRLPNAFGWPYAVTLIEPRITTVALYSQPAVAALVLGRVRAGGRLAGPVRWAVRRDPSAPTPTRDGLPDGDTVHVPFGRPGGEGFKASMLTGSTYLREIAYTVPDGKIKMLYTCHVFVIHVRVYLQCTAGVVVGAVHGWLSGATPQAHGIELRGVRARCAGPARRVLVYHQAASAGSGY